MSLEQQERVERRLVAIVAADVTGYSRLMGEDEEGTLAALKAIRRELADPKIAEHRGRIVKTTGDGLLAEFASVVDAVRCAVEWQHEVALRNDGVAKEPRIEFRIGINLGDIIIDEHDIYGDGVNVAARLEALAEPGGICVSRVVRDQVRDKLNVTFEDLGEQRVKNITWPVHVYRIPIAGTVEVRAPLALPDKPSIAVLPFQNMTGDVEQDYFVDGMVEEITTAISRLPWLFVIARNSSFTYKGRTVDVKQVARELGVRYVLEGSVRKAGNRVRITGQLIDTGTGAHIWADRFDGALDDIFELQDQVAGNVAGAIEPKLRQSEIERAVRKPTQSLDAYDLYLRALAQFRKWTAEDSREAIGLLRRALALDPSYAPAAGLFAWCRVVEGAHRAVSDEEVAEGVRVARQAVEGGTVDPDALWMGGWGIFVLGGKHGLGLSAIERSLAQSQFRSRVEFLRMGPGVYEPTGSGDRGAPASDAVEPARSPKLGFLRRTRPCPLCCRSPRRGDRMGRPGIARTAESNDRRRVQSRGLRPPWSPRRGARMRQTPARITAGVDRCQRQKSAGADLIARSPRCLQRRFARRRIAGRVGRLAGARRG
jgi:TolB-like protein/class 3 adenylate cyclase